MARTAGQERVSVVDLRCEYRRNPTGIGERRPRLSWRLVSAERGVRQAAYRILVASRPELLDRNEGDLWDSGRVPSDETTHRVYEGAALRSRQVCHWKVQVWCDGMDEPVESETAHWEMGLFRTRRLAGAVDRPACGGGRARARSERKPVDVGAG